MKSGIWFFRPGKSRSRDLYRGDFSFRRFL